MCTRGFASDKRHLYMYVTVYCGVEILYIEERRSDQVHWELLVIVLPADICGLEMPCLALVCTNKIHLKSKLCPFGSLETVYKLSDDQS